ncbi:MAG: hypothetical protein H6834_17105 [Planctomycetes bacterium]|nr:hypothetical protein [Planctomycetota bacterium]MCB9892506.1 hypothetical protein [Planctomycetota bacterium]
MPRLRTLAVLLALLPNLRAQSTVTVAVCQVRAVDLDVKANLAKVASFVEQAHTAGADLCVFPELIDTGFDQVRTDQKGPKAAKKVPGPTTKKLAAIAATHGVWIAAAVLEKVKGGVYDTSILIDDRGHVVLRQRKGRVYPVLGGGTRNFAGTYDDVIAVDSPWGPLAVVNCADIAAPSRRAVLASEEPALVLVSLANPPANEMDHMPALAAACGCPVVGANMSFAPGRQGGQGGRSRVVDMAGSIQWNTPSTDELMQLVSVNVPARANRTPCVIIDVPQTIRLPDATLAVRATADDRETPASQLAITWDSISGPATPSFTSANLATTNVTFPSAGLYELRCRVSDGSRTGEARASVNVLPADGSDPFLVGHWTFDDQTANDASGHANHGTLHGGATFTEDTPDGSAHALDLDGVDDFVQVAHDASLDAPRFVTLTAWVKLASTPVFYPEAGYMFVVNKGTWTTGNYAMGYGWIEPFFGSDNGNQYEMVCPSLTDAMREPGRWHHLAFTMDAARRESRIYRNGVLDQHVVYEPNFLTTMEPLHLGVKSASLGGFLHGRLDDVRVHTRILSQAEIAALVPGAVPNAPPLVDAGRDVVTNRLEGVKLKGKVKDDGNPKYAKTAVWVRWRRIEGPGRVWIEGGTTLKPRVTFETAGTYRFELAASDGGQIARDTVTVEVTTGR